MSPVSILIIAFNEEENIRQVLESVIKLSDDVFIVDSNSTDKTQEICKEYESRGVKIVQHPFENYAAQRNWALQNLSWQNEWVFWIDADEYLSDDLVRELRELFSGGEPECDFYYVKRRFIFLGKWLKHSASYPTWLIRLFRIKDARFFRPINEQVIIDGKPGYLKTDLMHDDRKGLSAWIAKHNRYSSMEAVEYIKVLKGVSGDNDFLKHGSRPDVKRQRRLRLFMKMPFRPLIMFLYLYVFKKGFLDGRPGFIYCVLKGINQFNISCKIREYKLRESQKLESH